MNNERIDQLTIPAGERSTALVLEHKEGWMSANAIAKHLESGLGDTVVWNQSLEEGVPSTKKKLQAIVSVHAIRFLAQKYLQNDSTLSEIQRNKNQIKEQYAPELVKLILKDIRLLPRIGNGFIPEYVAAKMLGITQTQLQDEMKHWVYTEGQVKATKDFNRVFLCFDPELIKNFMKE